MHTLHGYKSKYMHWILDLRRQTDVRQKLKNEDTKVQVDIVQWASWFSYLLSVIKVSCQSDH